MGANKRRRAAVSDACAPPHRMSRAISRRAAYQSAKTTTAPCARKVKPGRISLAMSSFLIAPSVADAWAGSTTRRAVGLRWKWRRREVAGAEGKSRRPRVAA